MPAVVGRLILPPRSDASGRPLRSWKTPRTRSMERLRYVAHAFQRAGSGGFPAARWWEAAKGRASQPPICNRQNEGNEESKNRCLGVLEEFCRAPSGLITAIS